MSQNQLSNYLFILLCIGMPFSKGLASVALIALLGISLCKLAQKPAANFDFLRETRAILIPSLIFLFYSISLVYTEDLSEGLRYLYRQNAFLVVPIVCWANSKLIKQNFRKYLSFWIGATTISCLLTLVLYFLPEATVIEFTESISFLKEYPKNSNRISFGLYSPLLSRIQFSNLVGLSIIANCWLLYSSKKFRLILLFSLGILLITSLILGGRGAHLGLLAAAAIGFSNIAITQLYPLFAKRIGKISASLILTAAIIGALIGGPILAYKFIPPIQYRYNQLFWEVEMYQTGQYKNYDYIHFTTLRRIVSWQNTWSMVKSNPILGVGIGDYLTELEKHYNEGAIKVPLNSHSQYLKIWATIGFFGFILFIGIILNWIYLLVKSKKSDIILLGFSFISFYLIVFFLDAVLQRQVDSMAFLLWLSWILAVVGPPTEKLKAA